MASDNHASYGKIGFTVFIGAFALAIALIYIAGIGNRDGEYIVETYYDHPVSGLSVGSPVNFRGVKIGEVKEISFASAIYDDKELSTNDFQRVVIVMAINCKRLDVCSQGEARSVIEHFIRMGIRATIASNAVTGMSRVEFSIPLNPQAPETLKWKPRYLQVPPQPSLMENMSASLARVLYQFNRTDFQSVWSNISTVASSAALLTKEVSEFVRDEREGLSEIVNNVKDASDSVDELAETLKNNPSLLLRENDPQPLPETTEK